MQKKIAYQGTKASFSETAILRYFGQSVEPLGKTTFEEVFESLAKFEYLFFVDIVFSEGIEEMMEALRSKTQTLKLLGQYEPAT